MLTMALQLLVNPINFKNAIDLIDLQVHKIFIGIKNFSIYTECLLTINEIEKLVKEKKQTKVYININKHFFENEINRLEKLLLQITEIKIDGIIFADFAIPQILYEHKIKTYLIYNPETLITNYGQFDFYLKNNIDEVCLARELQKNEIKEICKHKNKMKIQMQVCGYSFVMQSR
jgi:putative protease